MTKIYLIFPNQLFYKPILDDYKIYIIEEPRYFTDFNFHKMKLIYHRASMKYYYKYLVKLGYNPVYIDLNKVDKFYEKISKTNYPIHCVNVGDLILEKKLNKMLNIIWEDNINWLISISEFQEIKSKIYKNNHYSHKEFYKYQRIKLNILMKDNKPVGGNWSFDELNRKKLSKDVKLPLLIFKYGINEKKIINEAKNYINKHFPNSYGSDELIYPISTKNAILWFTKFLKERLNNFGPSQDYVSSDNPWIYHSIISPMMGIGILTDTQVINLTKKYMEKHKIPIASLEGFIRQVIGWRNYVYFVYMNERKTLYDSNLFNHTNKISEKFWLGNTGIEPIDNAIKTIQKYSYVHHIVRLMHLGNIMLLLRIHPQEVYRIFMEWTIDAYDWVMVPNVFGMSQYACASLMMNRPYFSSSNYIRNMSNFKKGEWCDKWDKLYRAFVNDNKTILAKNYSTANAVALLKNKKIEPVDEIIKEILN